jgi:hypothetical protein
VWGISLAILCSTLLHGTFFPATAKDTEQKGAEFLEKEIDEFHSKMVKLLEKANTQKETIAQLRSTIEQQAKEVSKNKTCAPETLGPRRISVIKLYSKSNAFSIC